MRYSKRQAIAVLVVLLLLLAAYLLYGWIGTALCWVAITLFIGAMGSRWLIVRFSLLALFAVCLWFLCVHFVYKLSVCHTCGSFLVERRDLEILRIPISGVKYYSTNLIPLVSKDFGCPCPHRRMEVVKYNDEWGRMIRYPSNRATYGESTPEFNQEWEEWYYDAYQPVIKKFQEDRPDLAEEFCTRVIGQGDYYYGLHFVSEIIPPPLYDFGEEKKQPQQQAVDEFNRNSSDRTKESSTPTEPNPFEEFNPFDY